MSWQISTQALRTDADVVSARLAARRLAELLGVGIEAVNVKATTTVRLGFTGRGEGMAAQAVAPLIPVERT